jgi:FixJ family two-component response regulator
MHACAAMRRYVGRGTQASEGRILPLMEKRAKASQLRVTLDAALVRTATLSGMPTVFIVDNDVSVRESLESLIAGAGWLPRVFASAREFLARPRRASPSCLVLELSLPDINGLELQKRIADRTDLPIIFITGDGDIPSTVRAMKAGAMEFLTKPLGPEALLSAIRAGIDRSRASLDDDAGAQTLRGRYRSLSPRERQVMALVVRGQMNKQVGGELGISEVTVKAHRGRMVQKMKAKSLAELVTMAARLGHATAGKGLKSNIIVR